MKIGVIQASSQADKNALLYSSVKEAAEKYGHEAFNLGCAPEDSETYTYIETAVSASLVLCAGAADLIVTGCSSGQGMMLALNNLPGVLCGYAPTPQDAYLFARINGGNAVSLPLGLGFGWCGEINLKCTLDQLLNGAFGVGYPPEDAARKRADTERLNALQALVKKTPAEFFPQMDRSLLQKALFRPKVAEFLKKYGTNADILRLFGLF